MHLALADELHTHRLGRSTVEPISTRQPEFTRADAYEVQAAGIDLRQQAGESVIGGKLGFTSIAMQRAMGVPSPNYGWLTDAMVSRGSVVLSDLIHPKAEPEILFRLGEDLDGPNTTAADVLSATASVAVCLEVVDSRYENFVFGPYDNIADNSSAGQLVIGAEVDFANQDLALVGVVVECDGEVVATAAGAASLDDPAEAVAWMARQVATSDRPLRAGDIVISGGLTAPVDLAADMKISVQIDRIGECVMDVRS